MSFGLEALFEERLESFPPEITSPQNLSPSSASATIQSLMRERDALQAQAKDDATTIDQLQRRIYSNPSTTADHEIPFEVATRLHRLDTEAQRLRKQVTKLTDNLTAAETETTGLRSALAATTQRVKGATKKTQNAKDVAAKSEERARAAVSEKLRRADAEKKMRREKNEALARAEEVSKVVVDLQAELERERVGGGVFVRDGLGGEEVVLVCAVEVGVRREHAEGVRGELEMRRVGWMGEVRRCYEKMYAVDESEGEDELGADHGDEEVDKLYGDMVETGGVRTGAEHMGWRAKRGLEKVCRNERDRHNF